MTVLLYPTKLLQTCRNFKKYICRKKLEESNAPLEEIKRGQKNIADISCVLEEGKSLTESRCSFLILLRSYSHEIL